jgi:hypothetical protein
VIINMPQYPYGNTTVAKGAKVTPTPIAHSTTAVEGIPANSNRLGLSANNTADNAIVYLSLNTLAGKPATLTAFDIAIPPKTIWECPYEYTGAINMISSIVDASGTVIFSELTP